MWVHLDLIKNKEQWTTVTRRKSNSKGKSRSCHTAFTVSTELTPDADAFSNTNAEKTPPVVDIISPAPKTSPLEAGGDVMTETPPSIRSSPSNARTSLRTQCFFKKEHIGGLFHLHSSHDRMKLLAV